MYPTLGAWQPLLHAELSQPYFQLLMQRLDAAYQAETVYPPREELFAAFRLTPPQSVRVVILGQDPYHEPDQANGLAFSVRAGVKLPPSLRNIFTELQTDCACPAPPTGELDAWAQQGVFLLNTCLSVARGRPGSHSAFGWQPFTDAVVKQLAALPQPIAFVLWGAHAQKKAALAARSDYPRLVLQAPHPSPLSAYRGFFGSRPFSQVNAFLTQHGERAIDWQRTHV